MKEPIVADLKVVLNAMGKTNKNKNKNKGKRRHTKPNDDEPLDRIGWSAQQTVAELEDIRSCLQRLVEDIQCLRKDISAQLGGEEHQPQSAGVA
jgi:hypothetical protein